MRRLARSALLLTAALALLAGACSPDETESADDSVPDDTAPLVTAPSTTVPPSTTAAAPEPVPLADIALDLELVAELPSPTAMTTAPGEDGTVLVSGREGVLYAVDLSGGGEPRPVLDFSDRVSTSGEQGFLGVATSPDGARVYVSYTDPAGATRIDEYGIDGTTVDEGSRREVFGLPQPFSNHNGGNIAFGPDELLYLGLGDGGAADDPDENGQDTTTLLGSMVRIDPTQQGSRSYGVPEDNPFTDDDGRTE
ncbi:MAG: PQQ-dependent sugar dehydrogenase, partial [Actinomycetota bacterium]